MNTPKSFHSVRSHHIHTHPRQTSSPTSSPQEPTCPISPQETQIYQATVVILGCSAVGKSAITIRYTCNLFDHKYNPTIDSCYRKSIFIDPSASFTSSSGSFSSSSHSASTSTSVSTSGITSLSSSSINIPIRYDLEILDTAGTEQVIALREYWISQADAFLLVFSINSLSTFYETEHIYQQILKVKGHSRDFALVLCGNKADLDPNPNGTNDDTEGEEPKRLMSRRQVKTSVAAEFAKKELGNASFYETSALNGENIDLVFHDLVQQLELRRRNRLIYLRNFAPLGGKKRNCVIL